MTRRIAVYGGSFNPFGNNHLDVIRYLAESGEFSQIILVPSVAHALKADQFPYEHRFNMTELGVTARYHAVPSFPEKVTIGVSLAEMQMLKRQPGPIYTYHLLQYLQKEHAQFDGEVGYRFVIGPDILDEIDQWKYVDEIRKDFGFFEVPEMGLHMSQVRDMIGNGVSTWKQHVPHVVANYIKMHGLYHVERVDCVHELHEKLKRHSRDPFDPPRDICSKCGLERLHHLKKPA